MSGMSHSGVYIILRVDPGMNRSQLSTPLYQLDL